MTHTLLVLKCNEKYLRVTDHDIELCKINKASVYPLVYRDKLQNIVKRYENMTGQHAEIYSLIISEQPYGM